MLDALQKFFRPPFFPGDEDKTRKGRYANAIAIAFLAAVVGFEVFVRISENYTGLSSMDLILVGLAILLISSLVLLKKGYVRLTSVLLVVLVWMASNTIAASGFGARDASYLTNFAIILMAGLLLGWPAALTMTVLSVISGFGLAMAEQGGWIDIAPYPVVSFARDVTVVFLLNGVLIFLLITGLEKALAKSRSHLRELESANTSLHTAQRDLQSRTAELLLANDQLERRTKKLHAIAEVTRAATALRKFDDLLETITGIISDRLGYHHVAVFLLDEQKQYAILRSASTDAGRQLLAQGHRLPVGQLGVVSTAAQSGQPGTLRSRTAAPRFVDESELPQTQSQLALPLKSGSEILGVLDLQSLAAEDFTDVDIAILSILADQVGIALQNALLFEDSQRALREANRETQQASQRAWQNYAETLVLSGYRYDGIKSEPVTETGETDREPGILAVPVELRGQTIGSLKLNLSDRSHRWSDDELVMAKATAERVALALEGARLLDEAEKRAAREAFLSEVSTKLSASFRMDLILRDTVQELGQALRDATVTFQLVEPSDFGRQQTETADG